MSGQRRVTATAGAVGGTDLADTVRLAHDDALASLEEIRGDLILRPAEITVTVDVVHRFGVTEAVEYAVEVTVEADVIAWPVTP